MIYLLTLLPTFILFIAYVMRLERRLTVIEVDIKWIVKNCELCQPHSEEVTT